MGYPLRIEGKLIEFPTKADADAWLLENVLGGSRKAPAEKQRTKAAPPNGSGRSHLYKMVSDFLATIQAAGPRGADNAKVFKAIGITSPNAFGNRGKNINAVLNELGLEPKDVYTNERNEHGVREWKAGPKMGEAIQKVTIFS